MALPRPYWTGQLRLSLVTIPVKLYSATSSERQIALHQIHEPSGKRIRYQKVAPGVGPVDTDEIIKGFEYEKGKYVLLEPEEIDELKLESKQTIELVRFVEQSEIDPRYFEKPYYVLPDGENAEEGYAVIQKALSEAKKVGLGQVVMRGKSSLVGIKPCGKGLLLEMLRQADEVRAADQFFDELPDVKVDKEALELGEELIKRKTGPFEPEKFKDDYTDAMWELIHAKIEKREPEFIAEAPASGKVINIMDALKKSVGDQDNKKSSSKSRSTKSKSTKSTAKNDNKSKTPRKKSA
ncbi:non-homologous end joining protein Ku [Methyloligella solikamskensis]|uniref:Non-homologous end joining protein Ku n=1 Tax=Methyloligella solikamskensis TaxID=1177756 RepID=A0ABW3J5I4_9HYPH